jgi:hypothetical protein
LKYPSIIRKKYSKATLGIIPFSSPCIISHASITYLVFGISLFA